MTDTAGNRKARRNRQGRGSVKKRTKGLAAAAALATAMTVGAGAMPLPQAQADIDIPVITQDPVYTAGLLAGVIAGLGINDISIPLNLSIDAGPLGTITIGSLDLVLHNVPSSPPSIYNSINSWNGWLTSGGTRYRFPATLGIGNGAIDLVNAYRSQIDSVAGNTPPGYTPFVPGPGQQTNFTSQLLLYVQDPYRPNGGLFTRFGPLLNLFGVDTTLPEVGRHTAPGIILNTATLDLTWAYDPLSDFPETLNPFSLLNSAFAALPTNLLGGVNIDSNFDLEAAGLNIADTLGIIYKIGQSLPIPISLPPGDGNAWYATLIPNDLPLLEPLRLPSRIINLVSNALGLGLNLGTPLADALQPALSILVNTGYTDVKTPTNGGTYERTFATSDVTTPFLSKAPLTFDEWLQVPGDVLRALVVGFQDAFPILRFGQTAPKLVVDGNHLKIVYPPAVPGATTPAASTVATETTSTTQVVTDPSTTDPGTSTVTISTSQLSTTKRKPVATVARPATATPTALQDNGSQNGTDQQDSTQAHSGSGSSDKGSSTGHSRRARAAS